MRANGKMQECSRFLLVGALLLMALAIRADQTEYIWTGETGDGEWGTAGNWEVDGVTATAAPNSYSAVARFTNDVVQTVHFVAAAALSRLSVERGTFTFTQKGNGNGFCLCDAASKTGTIHVAEGACADVRCGMGVGSANAGCALEKTGLGEYAQSVAYFGYHNGKPGRFNLLEGRWANSSTLYFTGDAEIVVANGATFETRSGGAYSNDSSLPGIPSVHVEEGGSLIANNVNNSRPQFDGFSGQGTISGGPTVFLSRGPYRFDGTVSGTWFLNTRGDETNDQHFVVGRPSNFESVAYFDSNANNGDFVRFAADQGGVFSFCNGYDMRNTGPNSTLRAEDENGVGVTVKIGSINLTDSATAQKFRFAGKGTILMPNAQYGQYIVSTNTLQDLTGFIGPKDGCGLTFGDRNHTASIASTNLLWNVGAVCPSGATLSYQAPGAVQRGSLTGGGTVSVNDSTSFMNFNLRDAGFGAYVSEANGGVRIFGGLASLEKLATGANWDHRPLEIHDAVISGPFAVDTALSAVVPTVLKRPVTPITTYLPVDYYHPTLDVLLLGNGEIHLKPKSAKESTTLKRLEKGTLYVHDGPLNGLTTVNGSRIAMCPPDTETFYPAVNAVKISAGGAEFVSGVSAGGAAMNYALVGVSGEGTFTRYGAGTFRMNSDPTALSGPVRILDGAFLAALISGDTDTSPLGSGAVELGNAKLYYTNWKALKLNETTVSGGALIVPGRDRVHFTTLAFEKGGALFLEKTDRPYKYDTTPADVPIFDYVDGAITRSAYCSADHVVLDGTEKTEPQAFAAHGILAVQDDTTVSGGLSGTEGLGIVGPADGTHRVVTLAGANAVSGGLFVNGVEVRVENAQALGTGPVTVGAGEWMGGRLRFTQPYVFANAVTAGGWGPVDEKGALVFEASTTLGSLAVSRPLRLRIDPGVTATVASAVDSDEHIQVAGNGGTLVLNGGKDGEGRLDIIKAKVRLTGAEPALGSGQIWLDNGTIEFANTSPIVVSNLIYGVGKIVCSGADVTFSSPSLDFDGKVEVPGSAHVSFHTQSQLGENLEVQFSRSTDRGASVDLGGVYRTVKGVVGFGTVTGVAYKGEEPPVWEPKGMLILVR